MGRVAAFAAVVAVLFSAAASAHAVVVAHPRGPELVVRAAPGGAVVAQLGRRTEFGSPLVLSVAARRGRWLGVITSRVANGRLGWIDARTVRTSRIAVRVDVSLSARRLTVLRGTSVVARIAVGVGRASSPTPTGVFAITDKLPGARFSSVYGCCILALSGHQPRLQQGWAGSGNRLAIHGGAFGAVSAGCLHARPKALRFLMQHVPLGTRVTIRR